MKDKLHQQNWLILKKPINSFSKKGIKHCLSCNVSVCDGMLILKYINESTALFYSLMLAARAGEMSVVVVKRKREKSKRIDFHLNQW